MAVAGIHKDSGFDSYLCIKDRPTTPTSSIRKMWRDLENEGRVKENQRPKNCGLVISPESPCSSFLGGDSMESEHTLRGANEIENQCSQNQNQNPMVVQEKEGARKIYSSSRMNNECKRVRIVRDWIESSTQQGDICRTTGLDESTTPIGYQLDCGARSPIRRIYGRQALIDLLTKFVRERKREVDDLLENRFVSNFAHRHRIQSLLKGRFLRNQRFVEDEKQTSVAESELGFLRQTHAVSVSDIRKGFLTRLNNYNHGTQSESDTSSDNEIYNYDRVEQAEEVVKEIPHEINAKIETTNIITHSESHNPPESSSSVHDNININNILQYDEREKLPVTVDYSPGVDQSESSDSDTSSDNDMTYELTTQIEAAGENFKTTTFTSTNPHQCEESESDSDSDSSFADEMKFDHIDQDEEIVHEIPTASRNPQECAQDQSNGSMKFDHIDQTEETVHEIPNGSRNPQGSHDDGGWYQETVGSDFQESHDEEWYDNDNNNIVDRTESWFGGNTSSYLESALVRSNTFYWSDDDDNNNNNNNNNNGNRVVELRELTSRRNVSNLLQSDFGARLDRLMQSYVSRQDHGFESESEWMHDHDHDQHTSVDASQTHVDNNLHVFLDSDYHLEDESEIINGLRIEMGLLEQRMNDMQKMLEACMEMQVELQRSVHQEIHSALNRSLNSQGVSRNHQSESNTQNGDCFLCCDDECESLPNRSAQMLHICSKCSKKVNWSKLKESVRHP